MSPIRLALVECAAALTAVVLAVTPGYSQEGWRPAAQGLNLTDFAAQDPQVAFNAAGGGLAVWAHPTSPTNIWYSVFRPAVGAWGFPMELSPAGVLGFGPDVALDAAGNGLAVWLRVAGGVYFVTAARFSAVSSSWAAPTDIAVLGPGGLAPVIAMTAAGDAVVVWTAVTSKAPFASSIHAARFAAASGTWTAAAQVSAAGDNAGLARVALNGNGDAMAIWTKEEPGGLESIQAARSVASGATWQSPRTLSSADAFAEFGTVAIDDSGNAIVAWQRMADIEVARYGVAGDTWSPAAIVSTGLATHGPVLAMDSGGNGVAVWRSSSGGVESARFETASGWLPTHPLAGASASARPTVAADPFGNLVAFWPSPANAAGSGQGARFVRAAGTWTSVTTIATTAPVRSVDAAADGGGNVNVVWDATDGMVFATKWSGAPGAPGIVAVNATTTDVRIDVTPPLTVEPAFAPTAYEYSVATGGWTRVPFTSPIVIHGLRTGVWPVAVRAVNAAGGGPDMWTQFTVLPDPPRNLAVVAVSGSVVTLAWEPPLINDAYHYVVEGGVVPGQVLATLPSGSAEPTFTFTAPAGTFYLRVRTAYFQLLSAPSNEVALGVNVAAPPSAPAHLLGLANGATVALSWTNTFAAGAPAGTSLVVTGALSGVVPLGQTDGFQFTGVPPGTYTFEVVAENRAGTSPPSNAVTLTFPGQCAGAPGTPLRLVTTRSGRTLRVSWSPADAGAAATGYVLLVSGAVNGAFPIAGREISATVPPGTYSFRVQAANPCGASAASAAADIVVP